MVLASQSSSVQLAVPAIIDVEASGFGRGSYPIEIGVATASRDSHCYLIRPAPGWNHWESQAEAVHGINRQTLYLYGQPVASVATSLNTLLAGQTIYTDAWGYDMPWLALLFDQAELPQRFRLESLETLLTDGQRSRWPSVKAAVTRELGLTRHRASADARIVQLTYLRTINEAYDGLKLA